METNAGFSKSVTQEMTNSLFEINLGETFAHMPNAPIVEAVIHWQARPEQIPEPEKLLAELEEKLPGYPNPQRQHEFGVETHIGPDGPTIQQHQTWHGFRFESEDKYHVAQFTRNGFVFSRLKPYESWSPFQTEAMRLWAIYCELMSPPEISRLGVRFINQIAPASVAGLKDWLTMPPCCPENMPMPLKQFMHQNLFGVPNHPYNLNVIQAIQPPDGTSESEHHSLILDFDVFTTHPLKIEDVTDRLQEMRWIKNKAFFTFLKSDAQRHFME
jgi:uncharacterized protein (TIGR04255 family)